MALATLRHSRIFSSGHDNYPDTGGNLQHSITQVLLCGTTGMNGQFPGQDFNLLDKLPVTAYDLTLFFFAVPSAFMQLLGFG